MKIDDIRELTDSEIRARIQEDEEMMLKLRFNHAISEIENPSKLRETKRSIARLKTILRERQLVSNKENK